jgi:hypothetical protein
LAPPGRCAKPGNRAQHAAITPYIRNYTMSKITSKPGAPVSARKSDQKVGHAAKASLFEPFGVTGRDQYIITKALTYAVCAIEALPQEWQEWSDCQDMKHLLRVFASSPNAIENSRLYALSHLRQCGIREGRLRDGYIPPPLEISE